MSLPENNNLNWFSLATGSKSDEISEYCEYCFNNFRKYNEMVQNMCISCGRPAPQLIQNPNENAKLTALNDDFDITMMNGISLEIDYTDALKDESISGIRNSQSRMQANSASEAMQMIRESEINRKFVGGDAYKVKIRGSDKKVRLDSNALDEVIR